MRQFAELARLRGGEQAVAAFDTRMEQQKQALAIPYPELGLSLTDEEKSEFITETQKMLAVQAENDIGEWLMKELAG